MHCIRSNRNNALPCVRVRPSVRQASRRGRDRGRCCKKKHATPGDSLPPWLLMDLSAMKLCHCVRPAQRSQIAPEPVSFDIESWFPLSSLFVTVYTGPKMLPLDKYEQYYIFLTSDMSPPRIHPVRREQQMQCDIIFPFLFRRRPRPFQQPLPYQLLAPSEGGRRRSLCFCDLQRGKGEGKDNLR